MNFKPRNDLLIVRYAKREEQKVGSIIMPDQLEDPLTRFEVVAVGPKVEDIQVGDIVRAEDASQSILGFDKETRIINQKYIHLIEYGKLN